MAFPLLDFPAFFKFHQGQQTWAYDLQDGEEAREGSPARVQGPAAAFIFCASPVFRLRVTDATVFASHERPFADQTDVVRVFHSWARVSFHVGCTTWYQTGFDPTAAHTCARLRPLILWNSKAFNWLTVSQVREPAPVRTCF